MNKLAKKLSGLAAIVAVVMAIPTRADVDLFICDGDGNIGLVDLTTDSVTDVGNEVNTGSDVLHDLAYVPSTGALYGTTFTGFYQVSTSTGAATEVGNYNSISNSDMMDGLVTYGSFFLASTFSNSDIYEISASPYSISQLSGHLSNSGGLSAGDLAFGADGTLYDAVLGDNGTIGQLWKVTISNSGMVTGSKIGDFTNGDDIVGLALGSDGVLYGVAGTEIFSINTSTGGLTAVFDYSGHGVVGAEGMTAIVPAPEPASFWLVAVAGLGLIAFRKLRPARA